MNHTHVVLIPKKQNPSEITDFRPISLCNVIYNMVTKVITNRLKEILPLIISDNQSAFMLERLIMDNIYVAFEIFHSMNNYASLNGAWPLNWTCQKPMIK